MDDITPQINPKKCDIGREDEHEDLLPREEERGKLAGVPEEAMLSEADEKELLKKCEKEKEEYLNLAKRLKADFENYKKDEEKKFRAVAEFSNYSFVSSLLPVLDDIELAQSKFPEEMKENEWYKGVLNIVEKLKKILEQEGVSAMEAAGKKFNPALHESVGYEEADGDEDVVVREVKKGYALKDKVLRPAQVIISKLKK